MKCKISQIWAKIGSNLRKLWKNQMILLEIWFKIGLIGKIGIWICHFFLKNWYLYGSTFCSHFSHFLPFKLLNRTEIRVNIQYFSLKFVHFQNPNHKYFIMKCCNRVCISSKDYLYISSSKTRNKNETNRMLFLRLFTLKCKPQTVCTLRYKIFTQAHAMHLCSVSVQFFLSITLSNISPKYVNQFWWNVVTMIHD